jgi:hypothetical protein
VSKTNLQRVIAAAIGLFIIGAVGAPPASPARGQGTTSIAVNTFQNEVGAPAGAVSDLSNALYHAVASSGRFEARGGGPLPYEKSLTSDPFIDALNSGAKAGAEELLAGSIVSMSGGQVYYRISLYRIAPVAFIASQIFSQPYPAPNAQALAAGFNSNIATLSAPRQAIGTVYSILAGVRADLGSSEGFLLGDRFNVTRGGQKVAEATISQFREDDATLSISNASPSYAPQIGDTLVGLRPLAPSLPAPPTKSSFNGFAFLAAVGGVLLAIGHHGQPGMPGTISGFPSPTPISSPFTVTGQSFIDSPPNITFTFVFNNLLSTTSQTGIGGNIAFAYVQIQQPGSQATTAPEPLQQIAPPPVFTTITGSGGQQESQMVLNAQNLVKGESLFFFFTSQITNVNGVALIPTEFFTNPLVVVRHPLTLTPNISAPVAPHRAAPVPAPPKVPPIPPKPHPGSPPR